MIVLLTYSCWQMQYSFFFAYLPVHLLRLSIKVSKLHVFLDKCEASKLYNLFVRYNILIKLLNRLDTYHFRHVLSPRIHLNHFLHHRGIYQILMNQGDPLFPQKQGLRLPLE